MDTQMPPSLDSLLTITFHHQTYDHCRIRLIQAIIGADVMLLQKLVRMRSREDLQRASELHPTVRISPSSL